MNQGFQLVKLRSLLRKCYGRHHVLVNICVTNDHDPYVPFVVNISRSFPHSWLITGFVTRVTLVEQKLLILSEHLISPSVFSVVRVTRSLVLCVMFCRSLFGHCVVCPSSIYGFWLPLWYIQTLIQCTENILHVYEIWLFVNSRTSIFLIALMA